MHKNNPDDFPELRLRQLRHYAKLWRGNNPNIPIVRIILYKYNSKNTEVFKTLFPQSQSPLFTVAFEVSGVVLEPRTNWVSWEAKNQKEEESIYKKVRKRLNIPDNINQDVFEYIGDNYDVKESFFKKVKDRFNVPDKIPNQDVVKYIKDNHRIKVKVPHFLKPEDIEALEKACEVLEPFKNKRNFISKMDNTSATIRRESIFISAYRGFNNVYKQPAMDNFHLDWWFIAIPPEGPFPGYEGHKVFLVLWDAENKIVEDIKPSDGLIKDNAIDTNQISDPHPERGAGDREILHSENTTQPD